jgi:hypothetical protein
MRSQWPIGFPLSSRALAALLVFCVTAVYGEDRKEFTSFKSSKTATLNASSGLAGLLGVRLLETKMVSILSDHGRVACDPEHRDKDRDKKDKDKIKDKDRDNDRDKDKIKVKDKDRDRDRDKDKDKDKDRDHDKHHKCHASEHEHDHGHDCDCCPCCHH